MMSDPPDGDGHLRTAWHPLLVMLLELLLPPEHWQVVAEYPLTREPRRIDAVIVRRLDDDAGWQPQYLRSVLADLSAHNLVHFKGATDALDRSDALQVLSYALQYAIAERLEALDVLTLRVVAPTLTPRFQAQWLALGGTLSPSTTPGVHEGRLLGLATRVVETAVVWPNPNEHLLYAVSPACLTDPGKVRTFDDRERALYYHLLQGITRLTQDPRWRSIMKDAAILKDTTSQALRDLLAVLPPEMRLEGLKPEERLVGLKPEERLVGLKPEERLVGLKPEERLLGLSEGEQVLAFPDAALRALAPAYIATLPAEVQAAIRARLAR
jgi:hypothetical protein